MVTVDGISYALATSCDIDAISALETLRIDRWSSRQLTALFDECCQPCTQSSALATQKWCFVARYQQQCVGYCFFQQVLDEAELLSVMIDANCRRQGLAYTLLLNALAILKRSSVDCCFLEVRESNTAAQQLYKKLGFILYHRREDYYRALVRNDKSQRSHRLITEDRVMDKEAALLFRLNIQRDA